MQTWSSPCQNVGWLETWVTSLGVTSTVDWRDFYYSMRNCLVDLLEFLFTRVNSFHSGVRHKCVIVVYRLFSHLFFLMMRPSISRGDKMMGKGLNNEFVFNQSMFSWKCRVWECAHHQWNPISWLVAEHLFLNKIRSCGTSLESHQHCRGTVRSGPVGYLTRPEGSRRVSCRRPTTSGSKYRR